MKQSKLVPLAILKSESLTIEEIAKLTIDFYKEISINDDNYSHIQIVSEKEPLFFNIHISDTDAIERLAKEILHQNLEKIIEMDKEENPSTNFLFKNTFISFALKTQAENETLSTLDFCFSTSKQLDSSIGSIVINEKCFSSYSTAKLFLDVLQKHFKINYSVIKIADREINKVARGYKAPLGWITYFSNNYEISIPNDLNGVEYEFTDNGKYLILTKEVPTNDMEMNKQKLLSVMEEIKRRVPEYSK